jgi:uncharacterized GH25 family protein
MRLHLFVLAIALNAGVVVAHDTWLLPAKFKVPATGEIVAEGTSAMHFPKPEVAMHADRIARSGLRLAGKTTALETGDATAAVLRFRARPAESGIAVLWVESRPRTLDLKHAEVEEYLKEIGAWDTAGTEWNRAGRKPWRETYVKFSKSHVSVGTPASDRSWSEPVGLGLEIVPETDPTALHVGDEVRLRILRNSTPLAEQAVGAQAAGRETELNRADASGRVTLRADRAGPWLVKVTSIRPAAREGEWESQFATLTFEVGK